MDPKVKTVVIEYVRSQKRVIVRGVWDGEAPHIDPLEPGDQMNYVRCFEGVLIKSGVGFTRLVPEE